MFSRSRFPPKGSDKSESLFEMYAGCVPRMVRCKCRAFLTCILDVFLAWSDVSARQALLTWMLDVFLPWSDISVEEDEDLHGG